MSEPVLRVAAKALLVNADGKILLLREANTYVEGTNIGRYGLPGGRINPNESYRDGLRREVEEETGIADFEIGEPLFVGEWSPVIKGVLHHIVAIFTLCPTSAKQIRLSDEHDAYVWVEPEKVSDYDVMGPEPEVIAAYLRRRNG